MSEKQKDWWNTPTGLDAATTPSTATASACTPVSRHVGLSRVTSGVSVID